MAIAEKLGVVDDIGRAYANWVWVLEAAGRLEEAIALAWVGVDSANALGSMRFFGSHILCNAGDDLYRLGRWTRAASAPARRRGDPLGINAILVEELLGRLAMARGRFDEAQERLAPLAQAAERAADIQFIIPVHASLAELALWQGKPDEAVAHVMAAIRLIEFYRRCASARPMPSASGRTPTPPTSPVLAGRLTRLAPLSKPVTVSSRRSGRGTPTS